MSRIENVKSYQGQSLDTIFFRPMLTGDNAEQLGIKVLYNMPVPTTLHYWKRDGDVLRKFTGKGWDGGPQSTRMQKTIDLHKVKAEMAYSASDYFSTVFELITGRSDVNLQDLSGTQLEEAETTLFRQSIAESIRSTMWYGNTNRSSDSLATFDGFITNIFADATEANDNYIKMFAYIAGDKENWAEVLLHNLWENASSQLRQLRSEGQLAFFVTTDVYNAYEESLDNTATEAAYLAKQNGRERLFYRGIPVIDVQLGDYKEIVGDDAPHSFALLTDRRNLALAVNTSDYPGTEVSMWYNPDEMENRQRAVFMAGCDYLLPELIVFAAGLPFDKITTTTDDQKMYFMAAPIYRNQWFDDVVVSFYDECNMPMVENESVMNADTIWADYGLTFVADSRRHNFGVCINDVCIPLL